MRSLIICCASIFIAFAPTCHAEMLTTATGYQLEYYVKGQDATGRLAIIIMHGKNHPPERVMHHYPWVDQITEKGFTIYRPIMPWSNRWDGTHEDATSAIDALVNLAAKDGKKVIIGGHSMGGMFTVLYRSSDLPVNVIGKFVSAPGHMLDLIESSSPFWNDINPSIERAKRLEAEGMGRKKTIFRSRNVKGGNHTVETYEMTPEVYLSFHDDKRLPSSRNALKVTSLPVLWTVGENDPLIRSNAHKRVFDMMPSNPKSVYLLLKGENHSTSFRPSIHELITWINQLVPQ